MNRVRSLVVAAFLVIGLLTGLVPLLAQSGSLYGASLDESAVLVRVINTRTDGEAVSLRVGSLRLSAPNPGDTTPYHPISADIFVLRYQGEGREFIPQVQTVYTLLAGDDELSILIDTRQNDPLRAQIYGYNPPGVWDGPLAFGTADGNTVIFPRVEPGASAQLGVNPLSLEIGAFSLGSNFVVQTPPLATILVEMVRGSSYSLIPIRLPNGNYELRVHRATIQAR